MQTVVFSSLSARRLCSKGPAMAKKTLRSVPSIGNGIACALVLVPQLAERHPAALQHLPGR